MRLCPSFGSVPSDALLILSVAGRQAGVPDLLDPCPPFLALDPVNGQSDASLDRPSGLN
jgi:hypothetical protein